MDEKFFENLARGKKAESEPETENAAELTVAESGGEHEMGSYEVELAKASASAVWLMPSVKRCARTLLSTCLSVGLGFLVAISVRTCSTSENSKAPKLNQFDNPRRNHTA